MNEFEQKLARQIFREPPPGLRAEILRACAQPAPDARTWRDWLWPSPQAWAALAALWIILAAIQISHRPIAGSSAFASTPLANSGAPTALLTLHTVHDFPHVLDLTN